MAYRSDGSLPCLHKSEGGFRGRVHPIHDSRGDGSVVDGGDFGGRGACFPAAIRGSASFFTWRWRASSCRDCVGLGVGLTFQTLGVQTKWFASALGAQLTWTLPFGMLIMFAVFSRFNRAYEEAARDLGATNWQIFLWVVLPILFPGMIAVALFGFTLSYDEFPRTLLTSGAANTLPMEIWGMTTNVTSPALYALGTVTTLVSFIAIALALGSIAIIQLRRSRRPVRKETSTKE